jgi:23S rRNA maturation-related 3'-5' exoribonuclease YhaM
MVKIVVIFIVHFLIDSCQVDGLYIDNRVQDASDSDKLDFEESGVRHVAAQVSVR